MQNYIRQGDLYHHGSDGYTSVCHVSSNKQREIAEYIVEEITLIRPNNRYFYSINNQIFTKIQWINRI